MIARVSRVVGVALSLLLPVSVAHAALPTTHKTLIVPGKSIGGAKLGSTLTDAAAAWGKTECNDRDGECTYEGKGSARVECSPALTPPTGLSCIVVAEFITARVFGEPDFKTPLARFKTSNGIGIGSTLKQLRHAFQHLKNEGGGVYSTYRLAGPGMSGTEFEVFRGRVDAILIYD